MKPKTEEQFKREIRRLKLELKKRDAENERIIRTNRQLTSDLEAAKNEIDACEETINSLKSELP